MKIGDHSTVLNCREVGLELYERQMFFRKLLKMGGGRSKINGILERWGFSLEMGEGLVNYNGGNKFVVHAE